MNRLLALSMGLVLVLVGQTGCYYSHLASGQLKLLWKSRPIEDVLADPSIDDRRAALLRLVGEARVFAERIGLDVHDQYTHYVEWPDDRIITTLVRSRATSVEPVPFWFPVLGELPYKGYFDRKRAEAEAARLAQEEAFDVCVSGVSAYSTLGWIDDPVTSPMLDRGAAYLVETIVHELVHATAYFPDDVDFSESVAQFIGQEAVVRFFEDTTEASARLRSAFDASATEWPGSASIRHGVEDRRLVGQLLAEFRRELAAALDRDGTSPEDLERLREDARSRLAALPLRDLDPERIAKRTRLSNACLALRGTYVDDLPRHAEVLAALGGDLVALIQRLRDTAASDPDGGAAAAFYEIAATRAGEDAGASRLAETSEAAAMAWPGDR